jgi:anaerobic magnesium-protoporphyrin IX monomethyl ester cyclase
VADITLINLNMLFLRYGEQIDHERHVPLGPLYLTRALEEAGFQVDFRDYQMYEGPDPFRMESFLDFVHDPAPIIGLSCMANLLPFSVLALKALRERYPDRKLVLGGVGSKAVEDQILSRFPWIDVICRGEGERTGPELLSVLGNGRDLSTVQGVSYRTDGRVQHNPARPRIRDLDSIPLPAFERIDLSRYVGYGMMTSRGCPYPCTFCSVAPVWSLESYSRSAANIVREMRYLNREAGVDLFLFQDEFFVSGKSQVMDFCREVKRAGLDVSWKAFGRVNLVDDDMMKAMADCGCVELRFGIESGSDRILMLIKKGFTATQALEVVPKAIDLFPRADAFYIWGFPFETMEDFNQSLMQMISFRMMGARILPSLLSLLPQTEIYRQYATEKTLEFCPYLLPEFVLTGHEVCHGLEIEISEAHREYFDLIRAHPDIFPGFFHIDLEKSVLPKLELLRKFDFYPDRRPQQTNTESCGAHSPHVDPSQLATRAD